MAGHSYDFGTFRLYPISRSLWRGDLDIHLTDTEYRILYAIIVGEKPDANVRLPPANRPLPPDRLISEVWPDSKSASTSDRMKLATHINNLRRKLGKTQSGVSYLRNSRDEGYFLSVPVELTVEPAAPLRDPVIVLSKIGAASDPQPRDKGRRNSLALAFAVLTLVAIAAVVAPRESASVVDFTELTNDGRPKAGRILTDGKRLFFSEGYRDSSQIVWIPISGGKAVPLPIAQGAKLEDISPHGEKLLFLHKDEAGVGAVWEFSLLDGSVRALGQGATAAVFRGDDSVCFVSNEQLLCRALHPGAETKRLGHIGVAHDLRWSPDGNALRFAVDDLRSENTTLWESGRSLIQLQPLERDRRNLGAGAWSRNGRYFFYEAQGQLTRNIWLKKKNVVNFLASKPIQLTHGPGSWSSPLAGPDQTLFALHAEHRPALVRFDWSTKEWRELWDGAADLELDYSPDRQWIAFVHEADHAVWKCRVNGSGRVQITPPIVDAHQPHWSHDGRKMAFVGKNPMGAYRVLVVPADGGIPVEIQRKGPDQGVPTWSADDANLLFGERKGRRPVEDMCLHLVNLASGKIIDVNGTKGLWSPRWSPDGTKVLAVTTDDQTIRVASPTAWQWHDLARFDFVDNVAWSYDSNFVYLNGRLSTGSPFRFYRVSVAGGVSEALADLTGFEMPEENWFGVSPDGSLLASRDFVREEICALHCKLP